jgi:hypothetical protein
MAQQGKQGIIGVCEGFPYNSVNLVLLANSDGYKVDPNMCFSSGKAFYPFKILPCSKSDVF